MFELSEFVVIMVTRFLEMPFFDSILALYNFLLIALIDFLNIVVDMPHAVGMLIDEIL